MEPPALATSVGMGTSICYHFHSVAAGRFFVKSGANGITSEIRESKACCNDDMLDRAKWLIHQSDCPDTLGAPCSKRQCYVMLNYEFGRRVFVTGGGLLAASVFPTNEIRNTDYWCIKPTTPS